MAVGEKNREPESTSIEMEEDAEYQRQLTLFVKSSTEKGIELVRIGEFIAAHELAHVKLGHLGKAQGVSYATTGVMLIINAFIPGAGYLNHVVNPAVAKNYNKTQEFEADKLASQASASCMGIPIERQITIL